MSDREDCFANSGDECLALQNKECAKCKFYKNKNDITQKKIERDIRKYIQTKYQKNEL